METKETQCGIGSLWESSKQRSLIVKRMLYCDMGTFSQIHTHAGTFWLLEPPWRDNEPFESCIPEGTYKLERYASEIVGDVLPNDLTYRLRGVPDRTDIVLHQGNTILDTEGCPMPGDSLGIYKSHWAVLNSVDTLSRILRGMEYTNIVFKRA